jgi:hypothetical protein
MGDDNAKVVDGSLVKGAFLWFEVKVVFGEVGQDIMGKCVEVRKVIMKE